MNDGPTATVLAFMDAINSRDVDKLCGLMTEDHRFVDGLGNAMKGRESMRKGWMGYFQLFPDYRVSHEEILSHGELVAVFGGAEGTYAPKGQPAKENHWSAPAAWMAIVKDNLIQEWRVYADNQAARKIMGVANP
jgi:uncharacterized protein (TIGR02246 family)